jgi:hypothetical protein
MAVPMVSLSEYQRVEGEVFTPQEERFYIDNRDYYRSFNFVWPFYKILEESYQKHNVEKGALKRLVLDFHRKIVTCAYLEEPAKLEIAMACGSSLFDFLYTNLISTDLGRTSFGDYNHFISYQKEGGIDLDQVAMRLLQATKETLRGKNLIPLFEAIHSVRYYTDRHVTSEYLASTVFQQSEGKENKAFYLLSAAFFDTVSRARIYTKNFTTNRECCACSIS